MVPRRFITDAEDMLLDDGRANRLEDGEISEYTRTSILTMALDEDCDSDWISRRLKVSVEDVEQTLARGHSSGSKPR